MTDLIGQMDEGYFVSRREILKWINHTLSLELQDIGELGTGAVYCQLIDSLYPGRVPMSKVNWRARLEHQFMPNYKLLQSVLDRLGIDKKIEMIQWLKRYIELQGGPQQNYDAVGRRGHSLVEFPLKKKLSNKQNTKKPLQNCFSSSHFRKSGIGYYSTLSGQQSTRKSHSPDYILNLTQRLHIRDTFQAQYSSEDQKFMSKTQRHPLRSIQCQDTNKLNEIRSILRYQRQDMEQLRQIRRLLTTQGIVEEEEAEFF